jgi:hypothetical protein
MMMGSVTSSETGAGFPVGVARLRETQCHFGKEGRQTWVHVKTSFGQDCGFGAGVLSSLASGTNNRDTNGIRTLINCVSYSY